MNEIDVVRDISCKFEQAGIAYMLTGSMAMKPRPTHHGRGSRGHRRTRLYAQRW